MDDHLTTNHQLKTGDTIWSEDFGNGFPSGWTIQDLSGICPWVWSNDGSWGYFNTNNGTSAGTGINSSTASNGFLICDTDSANITYYGQPSGSNYQWYFNGSMIPGANSSSFIANGTGNYSVLVTFANGCSNISPDFFHSMSNLLEFDYDNSKVSIYPNPAKEYLQIKIDGNKISRPYIFCLLYTSPSPRDS